MCFIRRLASSANPPHYMRDLQQVKGKYSQILVQFRPPCRKLESIRAVCRIPTVGMHITILGSGSAGNCTLIETDTTCLLVDAGLSGRQIAQRLALISRNTEQL